MAQINKIFYKDEKQYTDGDIERKLLDIARNGSDWEQFEDFPVLYHFSHIRENILNWYPFKEDAILLEVGSGCGALTGLLCQKVKKVYSIELTEQRANINFERHKEYSNLEIFIGNIMNMKFDVKFDYIILNGVLEYADSFIHTREPFYDLLNFLKKLLKVNGRLLIAIENRFGIKYFSGAGEDHTEKIFEGINGYTNNSGVRTFDKYELENLFKAVKFKDWKFYYPYPDYKFPTQIFTDTSIDSRDLQNEYPLYNTEKLELFNEFKVSEDFQKMKIMGYFANSFLIDIGSPLEESIEYVKLSNLRKEEFRIATIIKKYKEEIWVEKVATEEKSIAHIQKLYNNEKNQKNSSCHMLSPVFDGKILKYEYIKNKNLYDELKQIVKYRDKNLVLQFLSEFIEFLYRDVYFIKDYFNDNFKKYFGDNNIKSEQLCAFNPNIDLILDNIFYDQEYKYISIDNEWVLDGYIPIKFIVWRMLNEVYSKNEDIKEIIGFNQILEYFNISNEENSVFRKWATYFADNYVGCGLYHKYQKERYELRLNDILNNIINGDKVYSSLYIDTGNGFNESEKIESLLKIEGEQFQVQFDLKTIRNIKSLRWDPIEGEACICKINNISSIELIPLNSYKNEGGKDIFLNIDPNYQLILKDNVDCIEISGELEVLSIQKIINFMEKEKISIENKCISLETKYNSQIIELKQMIQDVQTQLAILEGDIIDREEKINSLERSLLESESKSQGYKKEIDNIKNTKAWKIINKLGIYHFDK